MDQSSHEIQREREQTRAALTEKIELLEERVRGTKKAVKQQFDYRYQTQRQPWKMLGASVAVGYLVGKVIGPGGSARSTAGRQPQRYGQPRKDKFKGAFMSAVVPMLTEFVKTASLRATSSRDDRPLESRSGDQARVLTPFQDESAHSQAVPPKPGSGTAA